MDSTPKNVSQLREHHHNFKELSGDSPCSVCGTTFNEVLNAFMKEIERLQGPTK